MTNKSEHIVRSFDQDLIRLSGMLTEMGGIVEHQIARAVEVILHRDIAQVEAIIAADERVDTLERDIEQFVLRLLALRQPMGDDLRYIVAALKISATMERIGDYAKNIAKRGTVLVKFDPTASFAGLTSLSRMVQQNLQTIITVLGTNDVATAIQVWQSDQGVDDVYISFFRELLTSMMEDPRSVIPCTHLMFVAKNLERIGDKATNIAEILHYAVTGQNILQARPKTETSVLTVIEPFQ
ncbi:MAG: phosphate signaling complex protein PhoU [Acetobacteraceae bacterium]|nr:phosphate signaling complex protein PhoU [Acetobacteraceae bacterium]